MKIKPYVMVSMLWGASLSVFAQGFGTRTMLGDWQFHLGDDVGVATSELKAGEWRPVIVPHDWSVDYPASPEKASCTGYLRGGIGWYRADLQIPSELEGKRLYLYFEGVYNRSEVFVNGASVGKRPNGFVSFMYDITDQVKPGDPNMVTVRVDHSRDADARWYTGSGIYRPAYLIAAEPVHLALWGVFYTTRVMEGDTNAVVEVQTAVENHDDQNVQVEVLQKLVGPDGVEVARTSSSLDVEKGGKGVAKQQLDVPNPKLWGLLSPSLYTLKTKVLQDGELKDKTTTTVGIRSLTFDPNKGFALNGEWMKIKGVCLHDDAGVLGTAVPKSVWRDRLLNLKAIGCNGIRMSHNPHSTGLYELCDELGFLVMDEAFDEWEYPKRKWIKGWNRGEPGFQGTADYFEEWGTRDVESMVMRDRNHPSIIMWSIGNEVDYPNDPYSHRVLDGGRVGQQVSGGYRPDAPPAERLGDIAKKLAAVVRGIDRSRPVTAALAGAVMSNETDYPGALDIVGYNYTEFRYDEDHDRYPNRVLYGSETRHDLAAWKSVADNDFIFGQFIWTGFDYLGEAGAWPSRGFTTGMIDLANNIKPIGWFRRALWADEPVAYLGTYRSRDPNNGWMAMTAGRSWNYEDGQKVRVVCYTNGDEAELFLNGEKVGERKSYDPNTAIIHWDMTYQLGELKVVVYKGGEEVASDSIKTAGKPLAIKAAEKSIALKEMHDVAAIPISVVDADGHTVFGADHEITCEISGPGRLLGLENAVNDASQDFNDNKQKCKNGRLLAYVQATAGAGTIDVSFTSGDLQPEKVQISIGDLGCETPR